jgi:hypothetical protein
MFLLVTPLVLSALSQCLADAADNRNAAAACVEREADHYAYILRLARPLTIKIYPMSAARIEQGGEINTAFTRRSQTPANGCSLDFLPPAARDPDAIAHEVCHCFYDWNLITVTGTDATKLEQYRAEERAIACAAWLVAPGKAAERERRSGRTPDFDKVPLEPYKTGTDYTHAQDIAVRRAELEGKEFARLIGLQRPFDLRLTVRQDPNSDAVQWTYRSEEPVDGCQLDFLSESIRDLSSVAFGICNCRLNYDIMTAHGVVSTLTDADRDRAYARADACVRWLTDTSPRAEAERQAGVVPSFEPSHAPEKKD